MKSDLQDEGPELQAAPSHAPRRLRSAQDVRDRRRRYAIVGLTFASVILLVNAVVGENGYLASLRARAEQRELEHGLAALRMENQRLQLDGRRLTSDPSALEETARRTLGLMRPGETLLIVRDAVPPGAPPSSK